MMKLSPRGTPEEIAALKIGDTLYNFDTNRRSYRPGSRGGPIYEKHFAPEIIVGETKVSWIVGTPGAKVNKKTLDSATSFGDCGYFTTSAMEANIWIHHHRREIIRLAENADFNQLREIARIVGYEPTNEAAA